MSHCLRDDTPSFLPLEPQVTVVEAGPSFLPLVPQVTVVEAGPSFLPLEPQVTVVEAGPSFLPLEPQVTVVEAGSENFAERDSSKGKSPSSGPKDSSMTSSNKWKSPTSAGMTSLYRGKSPTSSGRQSTSSGGNSPTLSNTKATSRGKSPKLQPRGRGKSPTLLEVEADISSQIDALFGDCEVLAEDSQEGDAIPQTSRLLSAPSPAAVALETCSVPDRYIVHV